MCIFIDFIYERCFKIVEEYSDFPFRVSYISCNCLPGILHHFNTIKPILLELL
jgi:hypothetical protein